jgi:hypothetical protein
MFLGTPHAQHALVQRLADGIRTDADRQFMLVMALALAGRPPSKEHRRSYANYIVMHPSGPSGSYLRLGSSFKTSSHIGPYKDPLNASLHRAILTSLRQQPRRYLFEPPSKPGQP